MFEDLVLETLVAALAWNGLGCCRNCVALHFAFRKVGEWARWAHGTPSPEHARRCLLTRSFGCHTLYK
ncbi:hypothetical protein LINGRAHAP2_LOCUS2406 [Linum grandiflorum]